MRYFRASSDEVYEQARLTLDAVWGHPDESRNIRSCITPAVDAPRGNDGRVVLAVHDEFVQYSVAVDLLPQLLAMGVVDEIDAATYHAAANPGP